MSRILSQDEVDALLEHEGPEAGGAGPEPVPFDLSAPPVLAAERLERARQRAASIVADLRRALDRAVRLEPAPTVELSGLRQQPAGEMIAALAAATVLVPLRRGRGPVGAALAFDPRVAGALCERLLGGPGRSAEAERLLTPVETSILGHLGRPLAGVVARVLVRRGEPELEPQTVRSSPGGVFAAGGGTLVAVTWRIELPGGSGTLELLLTPEEALALAGADAEEPEPAGEEGSILPVALRMEVSAVPTIPGGCMAVGEILGLREGHVVRLDTREDEPLRLVVNGQPLFRGFVRAQSGRRCFEVSERITEAEDAASGEETE